MKYLFVSDIHGSLDSTKHIINKFNENHCDKIIILGDILYHGPRNDLPDCYNPKKVIELLNPLSNSIIAIKGNCDAEVDQMVLNFKIHDNYILNNDIYLTHGHHVNYLSPLNNENIKTIIHGHTHIIKVDVIDNKKYINLGSITIPKENTRRCYAILEENVFSIYDLQDNLLMKVNI